MKNTEKMMAIALVEDMVAHGYKLMQYKTAQEMVERYSTFPLPWWQESHDRFVNGNYAK